MRTDIVNKFSRNKVSLSLSLSMIALCAVAVLAQQAGSAPEAEREPAMIPSVSSAAELQSLYFDDRQGWLPITIPGKDPWTQSAQVVAVDVGGLPKSIVATLSTREARPTNLTIAEDPVTRDTLFLDPAGRMLYRLPPPKGYDPLSFVLENFAGSLSSWLGKGAVSDRARERISELIRHYDPARLRLSYRLIDKSLLPLWQEEEEERIALAEATVKSEPLRSLGDPDELWFSGIGESNGVFRLALHVPDGAGSIDIFTTDNLEPPNWGFAASGLTAQSNLVEWTDSAGASNRFYRVADQTDTDGDGLSDAAENLVYGTDLALFDTDGDGMPDGYEVQHGFDPLAGIDGAQDADGDGIPNANEYAIGTEPNQADTVVDVDPADAVLETKSFNYGELRGGFEGYLNPSNYYLHAEMEYMNNDYYEEIDIDRDARRMLSRRETGYPDEIRRVWELDTWSLTQQVYHVTDYISGTSTNTYAGDVDIPLDYDTLFRDYYSTPSGFSALTDTSAVRTNSNGDTTCEYNLSDLYTVQNFKDDVEGGWQEYMDGGSAAVFDSVAWNDSHHLFINPYYGCKYNPIRYRYFTDITHYSDDYGMEEYGRAVRDMADGTEWMHLSAIQYRWKLPDAADVVYRVNTLHIFEPEDSNQPAVVDAVHQDYVKGSGSGGDIYTQPRIILPPDDEGSIEVVALKLEIRAADGESDPSEYICAEGTESYTAVVIPSSLSVYGDFDWSTESAKIALASTSSPTVTVNAGSEASDDIGAENLKLEFIPHGSAAAFAVGHDLTVTAMNLLGVNGDGFVLTDTGEYANRVWLGTWLNLKPEPDLFDWSVLKEYGGGVILSRQEFSWELTSAIDDEVYPGSKGPMYFVDEFEVDSNGELIPSSSNGVWPAEPAGTGYGMHMSLLNVETYSMINTNGFNVIPDEVYPYKDFDGTIIVKFEAELYPAGAIPSPTSGFNSPSGGGGTTDYHPFYPEICHKYWSPNKPSWAGSDPICTMEQTFEITWEAFIGAPSCSPSLPNGPNRLGK